MSTYARARLPGGVLTLPGRYYTDPGHFALEMERIYCRMWVCAGRAEQLAQPGRYFLRQLGNASVVVLRNDENRLAAFHNVCRHRGTRLCTQDEGQLPSRIQCGYHGWTYRLDGTLAAAPHMDEVDGFQVDDYPCGGSRSTSGTATSSSTSPTTLRPSPSSSGAPREVPPLGHAGPPARGAPGL